MESRVTLGDSTMLHRKSGSVLGYSQPCLRDWFVCGVLTQALPGWAQVQYRPSRPIDLASLFGAK
jgi:hypothetical protein